MLEQPVPEELHSMEGIHIGAVCEKLLCMGIMLEKFTEDCLLWKGPDTGVGSRQSVRSPEEGVAETMHDEPTTAPTPCSHE